MIPMTAMRHLGPWLVGLFLAGQIFGVVPLVKCHSAHAAGAPPLFCACDGSTDTVRVGHHHAGDADDAAHHHALQDLTGVLPRPPDRREVAVVHMTVALSLPSALAEAERVLLERPPKPLLSI
jgi:hypothetical protein